jgi:hypothetical protein
MTSLDLKQHTSVEHMGFPKFTNITTTCHRSDLLLTHATGTPHYNVGKFLAKLLNPLAQNEYTLRDSFHAVSEIKSIPKELITEGYRLVSFDVVSLFTNVPLTKTVKIILDRVF